MTILLLELIPYVIFLSEDIEVRMWILRERIISDEPVIQVNFIGFSIQRYHFQVYLNSFFDRLR